MLRRRPQTARQYEYLSHITWHTTERTQLSEPKKEFIICKHFDTSRRVFSVALHALNAHFSAIWRLHEGAVYIEDSLVKEILYKVQGKQI